MAWHNPASAVSTCNTNASPSPPRPTSPANTIKINNTAPYTGKKKKERKNTECLLERANDLIVDCVSMSECFTKLPTRVERRSEEGRRGRRRSVKRKKKTVREKERARVMGGVRGGGKKKKK